MSEVLDRVEEKGIEKGRDDTLFSLVYEGHLDIEIAADKAGKSVEQFKKDMRVYLKSQKK